MVGSSFCSRLKAAWRVVLAIAFCGAATAQAPAATYAYTGNTFTAFNAVPSLGRDFSSIPGSYDRTMSVSGSFTVAAQLGANMAVRDIGASLVSWDFSNGRASFTEANSIIDHFFVETDGIGAISRWQIWLQDFGAPALRTGEIGSRLITRTHVFTLGGTANTFDQGLHFLCRETSCTGAFSSSGDNEWGFTSSAGTWASPTVVPLPAGAALLLGGLAALTLRRRTT